MNADRPISEARVIEPVLLIGGGGMLGRQWRHLMDHRGLRYAAPPRDALDLRRPRTLAAHVTPDVATVINCAAFTDVDACESPSDYAVAEQVNGHGVGALAEHCAQAGATLVHYSTDYVFDGHASRPYRPGDLVCPVNSYGETKAIGEQALRASGCPHLILRTSWLYAPWGHNFLRTILRLLETKPNLRVVNDQRGCPTSAEHLAQVSLALLGAGQRGTLHVTDGGACTWYDFAAAIAELVGSDTGVAPCTTAEFPRPAARPVYSVLDTSETEHAVRPMPGWRTNLAATLRHMEPITS